MRVARLIAASLLVGSLAKAQGIRVETSYNASETTYGGLSPWSLNETFYNPAGLHTTSSYGLLSQRLSDPPFREIAVGLQSAALGRTSVPLNMPPVREMALPDQLAILQRSGATRFIVDGTDPSADIRFFRGARAVKLPLVLLTAAPQPEAGVPQVIAAPWPVKVLATELAKEAGDAKTVTIEWMGLGILGAPQVEEARNSLREQGVVDQPWGDEPGGSGWVVIVGNWTEYPAWSREYALSAKMKHPGARLAILASGRSADPFVREGIADMVVRPDWDGVLAAATRLLAAPSDAPVTVPPVILKASAP